MWDHCGMARTKAGLETALREIPRSAEEFHASVNVPGSADTLNQSLEQAGRVADFLELGELMCRDALTREESCGGHFREEHQYPDGECQTRRQNSPRRRWEFQGEGRAPVRNAEPLNYEFAKMTSATAVIPYRHRHGRRLLSENISVTLRVSASGSPSSPASSWSIREQRQAPTCRSFEMLDVVNDRSHHQGRRTDCLCPRLPRRHLRHVLLHDQRQAAWSRQRRRHLPDLHALVQRR